MSIAISKAQEKAEVAAKELRRRELEREKYDWSKHARPSQLPPPGDWSYWLILAGRGFGKTRTGAELVRQWVKNYRYVNLIAATAEDARTIMIEGESGILAKCPKDERPRYLSQKNQLDWPNGAKSLIFTAEEPERLRGKQHEKLWCDEIGAWRYQESWDQAKFGLRLGNSPQACLTTTPRPGKLLRELIEDPGTVVSYGTTYDNRANLSKQFYSSIIKKYEGTRLGQQELDGKLLTDVAGALWAQSRIDELRLSAAPALTRIIVAIDPAVTSGEEADETGIVVVAKGSDGHGYVLCDRTGRYSPGEWARMAVDLFREYRADAVIAEANNGGDLVEANIRTADPNIPFRKVWASRGKVTRAEPIASLYEQGRFHHIGVFRELEDEMTSMTTDGQTGSNSPNRADALVWGASELMIEGGTITLFPEFRSEIRRGEPHNAHHISVAHLEPWWYRWMSAGFSSAGKIVHWYVQSPNGQVHLVRERQYASDVTAQQFGAELARVTMPDCETQSSIEVFITEDAFEKSAGRSPAQQLAAGIMEVLGPDSTFLWELTADERMMEATAALQSREARRRALKGHVINLRPAASDHAAMWEYLREMLRWKQLTEAPDLELTREQAVAMLAEPDGRDQYMAHYRKIEGWKAEVLPRLLLHPSCSSAIQFLSTAMRDPKHAEQPLSTEATLLSGESLRCGVDGARGTQARIPKEIYISQKLETARKANPELSGSARFMIASNADKSYDKQYAGQSFSFARRRRR